MNMATGSARVRTTPESWRRHIELLANSEPARCHIRYSAVTSDTHSLGFVQPHRVPLVGLRQPDRIDTGILRLRAEHRKQKSAVG
jgi:hypothetical protein